MQQKQIAATQQAALAASNIYANTYYNAATTATASAHPYSGSSSSHQQQQSVAAYYSTNSFSAPGDVGLNLEPQLAAPIAPVNMLPLVPQYPAGPFPVPVVVPPVDVAVVSQVKAEAETEPPAEMEEDEDADVHAPEIDEKQMAYSTMEGVKLLAQPAILKAELHEHQVRVQTLTLLSGIV